ncbi:MAG: hypothetical protein A4E23_01702 [Methanomethylovorans sp. PtaU1.Bin073]|nr:MAG: hypothetical protein A4E23_01702 [Methanomethylovorans sp. PtaU1.Bin073]
MYAFRKGTSLTVTIADAFTLHAVATIVVFPGTSLHTKFKVALPKAFVVVFILVALILSIKRWPTVAFVVLTVR